MNKVEELGGRPVTVGPEAFTSEAYARAEADKLWPKIWQHVGRVEEIPNVGDYITYDIMDDTIVVVRSEPGRIQAFFNVCQHRGRRLVDGCGNIKQFFCKYHAWRYNLKGENVHVLDKDDWGGALQQERLNLPEVKCDTWGGWIWINMDPGAQPLRDYLEPLASLLDALEFEKMRYRWRKRGIFNCNWKVATEAFIESYHVEGTHPQLLKYAEFYTWSQADGLHTHKGFKERKPEKTTAESNTYFRSGKGNDARLSIAKMQEEIFRTVNAATTQTLVDAAKRLADELPEGTPASEVTAHWLASARRDDAARGVIWPTVAPEHLAKCGTSCHLFPNLGLAYGIIFSICYTARPYGSDPNKCIFETYVIERFPEGKEPQTEWVLTDGKSDHAEWPLVLLQDYENMDEVQRGMRSRGFRGTLPNPRQELVVSRFHENLARFMGAGAPQPLP